MKHVAKRKIYTVVVVTVLLLMGTGMPQRAYAQNGNTVDLPQDYYEKARQKLAEKAAKNAGTESNKQQPSSAESHPTEPAVTRPSEPVVTQPSEPVVSQPAVIAEPVQQPSPAPQSSSSSVVSSDESGTTTVTTTDASENGVRRVVTVTKTEMLEPEPATPAPAPVIPEPEPAIPVPAPATPEPAPATPEPTPATPEPAATLEPSPAATTVKAELDRLMTCPLAPVIENNQKVYYKDGKKVFIALAELPQFGKGEEDLKHWLSANMQYPDLAKRRNVNGKLTVKFVVNEDGTLSDAYVTHTNFRFTREPNPDVQNQMLLDFCREGLRLIRIMPRWHPGKSAKPEKMWHSVTITFMI